MIPNSLYRINWHLDPKCQTRTHIVNNSDSLNDNFKYNIRSVYDLFRVTFQCFYQSAEALVKTMLHDKDDLVRETAYTMLKKHPKSKDRNFILQHETEILRWVGSGRIRTSKLNANIKEVIFLLFLCDDRFMLFTYNKRDPLLHLGRKWCGILYFYWWTASIKPSLLFLSCGLYFSDVCHFIS